MRAQRTPSATAPVLNRPSRRSGREANGPAGPCRRARPSVGGVASGDLANATASAALNAWAVRARTPSGPLPPGSAAAGVEWP